MPNTGVSPHTEELPIQSDAVHVVAAFIWHQQHPEKFLISRRPSGKHLENYWELPGGKREADETRWQALHRELEEELGILISAGEPYMYQLHSYEDRNILLDVWQVTRFSGRETALEQQEIAWITVDQIEQYRFPPADLPILGAIKNSAITGN